MAIASLIGWLASGVRGCESGSVQFCQPGGLVVQTVYKDAACAVAWPTSPDGSTLIVSLDTNGRAFVFANALCRMIVKDSAGATVFDDIGNSVDDSTVRIDDALFNAGTPSSLHTELHDASTQFGGSGFQYKISASPLAVPMNWQDWANHVHVDVQALGAKGDGLNDDTAAIQAAVDAAIAAAGGGVVLLPPGNYVTSAVITANATASILIRGAGPSTVIKATSATANCIQATGAAGSVSIEDLTISHAASSTGAAVQFGTSTTFPRTGGLFMKNVVTAGHKYGVRQINNDDASVVCIGCVLATSGAGARSVYASDSRNGVYLACALGAIEFLGTASRFRFVGCDFAAKPIFNAGLTGRTFVFDACAGLDAVEGFQVDCGVDPDIRHANCGLNGYSVDVGSGSHTPTRQKGLPVRIKGTADCLINPPLTPSAGWGRVGGDLELVLVNGKGGGVAMGWSWDATYVLTGMIDATDGKTTVIRFLWEATTNKWVERSRAVT